MRYLLALLLFFATLIAYEGDNGTAVFLEFDKEFEYIVVGEKKYPLFMHPSKKETKVIWLPLPYKNKNDIKATLIGAFAPQEITIHVRQKEYKKEQLQVSKNKVKPPKELQDRIWLEYKEAKDIYNTINKKRYWSETFGLPMNSKITSQFGNARVFNGLLKSYHSGTDFRAAVGTVVKASNDGVVVIAKDRYYAGGSVVIDHGEGIYSQYYHLSDIVVKKGQKVTKAQVIGKSGKSGRVTGPHLHFGFSVLGNSVNPLAFIEGINRIIAKD